MRKERIIELTDKTIKTLKEEGLNAFINKTKNFVLYRKTMKQRKDIHEFKDILFINGCSLPHPQRYRVDHQIEQLEAYGITCSKIDYDKLTLDLVKYFRGFVVYRCPIIPTVEEFIKLAHENNKETFYDIDDLVFDIKYTNQMKFLKTFSKEEKDLYDDGVKRMGQTLKLCHYGIATTERLQNEMSKYLKEVYINRNVMSEEMVKYSQKALKIKKQENNKIIMGYLSGSITHNDDFNMIMPSIVKIMNKYDNVYLQIVGLLDLPKEMKGLEDRIITAPFMDYRKLPELIHSIDINLAPLEQSIFNEAKSENKWTEAALVKIPTIASNVGAFKEAIVDGKTGILCNNNKEWEEKLSKLIEDKEYRNKIGNNAYNEVMNHHLTIKSGYGIAEFIKSKLNKNICFVVPSTNISGGIMVTFKHASILKKNGYDVTIINAEKDDNNIENQDGSLNVIPAVKTEFGAYIDTMVATMWLTLPFVKGYSNCSNIKYLVQNYETDFYEYGKYEKLRANATYNNVEDVDYITISKWCQNWLKDDFKTKSLYAPNGIDLSLFKNKKRKFKGKIKILVEGNSKDYYKNVDESFKIVDKLDKEKYEIHYLSYAGEPKKTYYVDKFYHKVPHNEVSKIYSECDILIKSSILESFSYPPLEMMATGGLVVVAPNGGNVEYLKDKENCLFYELGNIDDAVLKIERLRTDSELRNKLIESGLETAKLRNWKKIESDILRLYEK